MDRILDNTSTIHQGYIKSHMNNPPLTELSHLEHKVSHKVSCGASDLGIHANDLCAGGYHQQAPKKKNFLGFIKSLWFIQQRVIWQCTWKATSVLWNDDNKCFWKILWFKQVSQKTLFHSANFDECPCTVAVEMHVFEVCFEMKLHYNVCLKWMCLAWQTWASATVPLQKWIHLGYVLK